MEDQIAEIERRLDEWEVRRIRSQRGALVWFSLLTVLVIGSLMLMLSHQGQALSAHQSSQRARHTQVDGR